MCVFLDNIFLLFSINMSRPNLENVLPTEISQYAAKYSIPFFLVNAGVALYYRHHILGILQIALYISSYIFWNRIFRQQWMRTLDMSIAITNILYATYVTTPYLGVQYEGIWCTSIEISICVFCVNEFTFFVWARLPDRTPNDWICYTSVFTHMLFLHILPSCTSMYCIINGSIVNHE